MIACLVLLSMIALGFLILDKCFCGLGCFSGLFNCGYLGEIRRFCDLLFWVGLVA